MDTGLLFLHWYWRWVVLVTGIIALWRGLRGWQDGRPWTAADDRAGRFFTIAFDIQFLLGLILYVAGSPMTRVAWQDMGAAMGEPVLRYWAVEHAFGMIVALALAHVGRVRIRRMADATRRHRTAAIFFGLSLFIVLATMPWPGLPYGRPLVRS